jgi:hypothetical protein
MRALYPSQKASRVGNMHVSALCEPRRPDLADHRVGGGVRTLTCVTPSCVTMISRTHSHARRHSHSCEPDSCLGCGARRAALVQVGARVLPAGKRPPHCASAARHVVVLHRTATLSWTRHAPRRSAPPSRHGCRAQALVWAAGAAWDTPTHAVHSDTADSRGARARRRAMPPRLLRATTGGRGAHEDGNTQVLRSGPVTPQMWVLLCPATQHKNTDNRQCSTNTTRQRAPPTLPCGNSAPQLTT